MQVSTIMDQDQNEKSLLLTLPIELFVYIVSFIPSLRDRIKLRYVSRWFKCMVEETPSLWKEFVWPYYDSHEEYTVKEVLKVCGQHVQVLSFPNCTGRLPLTVVEMLKYCSNVQRLSLPLTKLDNELVTKALNHTRCLRALDLQTAELNKFSQDNFQQLLIIISHLRELTVNVDCNGCLLDYLKIWIKANCRPPNFHVFCTTYQFMAMHFSSFIHTGPTANVRLYNKSSKSILRFFPVIPFFQMHFEGSGQLTTPCVKLSDHGILGLEEDVAVMNDNWCGRKTMCAVWYRNKHIVKRLTWPHSTKFYNLTYATHFSFTYCYSLHPGHLEQLAIACPNLQRLALQSCKCCLESLKGLKAIASHCHYLQGLNLFGIHASKVEDKVLLWEILRNLRLTHLAVGFCLIRSEDANRERLNFLYQNCWTLRAIQCNSCNSCGHFTVNDAMPASFFPSLNHFYLRLESSTSEIPTIVQEMISNCKTLECASFIASYALLLNLTHNLNLHQLYIDSPDTVLPDEFMTSVSAHGELLHVVMRVECFIAEDMEFLVRNSPKLMTLEIHTNIVRCRGSVDYENINDRLKVASVQQ